MMLSSRVDITKNISNQVDQMEYLGSKDDNVSEHVAIYDYADMISIEDEFSVEDEALALAHIEVDIRDFEDLKQSIDFLETRINKHADIHVVKSKELLEVDAMLKNLNTRVVLPYEQELKALKTQILKLNHTFDNKTIAEISAVVENAEMFLETSRERIELVESRDEEWDLTEESAKIQEMFEHKEKDNSVRKLIVEAIKPAV